MSFKISNTLVDEANRDCAITAQNALSETVSTAKALNPSIPVTKLVLTGSYNVTLPNGTIGDRKFVTAISGGGSATVQYKNGWGTNNNETITLGYVGDSAEFVATVSGWHLKNWINV
jgi:hypothetical protein